MDALQRNNLMIESWTPQRVDKNLTTAEQTILTAPASGWYEIFSIVLNEYSNNADTFSVYRRASGDAGATAAVESFAVAEAIAAKTRVKFCDINNPIILRDGDILSALAGTNSRVNMHVEYKVYR